MGYISINYEDGTATGYESVELHYGRGENEVKRIFNSGNFLKDWYDMRKVMITEVDGEGHYSHSSSVDHFIMDGAPYESAYLHVIDGKAVLLYVDETQPDYLWSQSHVYENGIEFFVEEGTKPTWEELKELYSN